MKFQACGARLAAVSLLLCGGVACGNKMRTREAVERGIRQGVAQRGLNVDNLDVSVTNLKFHGDKADAMVSFAPKGAPISQGMSMRYTLEEHGGNWVIVGRSQVDMQNHAGGAALPSDHPAVGGAAQ